MKHGQLNSIGCSNPCSVVEPLNTAACETLPSQIENFTLNFFGEIFKTEVNGEVQWSLPGRLDVGLLLNPRFATEPLGCYFLRLFENGVVGAQGEQGLPGADACNGSTPYVQVLAGGFPQPQLDVVFAIKVTRNPSILPGMDVFIEGSGWYEIGESDGKGNITISLKKAVVNPHPWVDEGTVLLPSGKVGGTGGQGAVGIQGIQGRRGDKGDTGDQGIQGDPAPASAVALPLVKANIPKFTINWPSGVMKIDGYQGSITSGGFVNLALFPGAVPCTVTLPKPGTYLLIARAGWGATPLDVDPGLHLVGAQANPGINFFRMRNLSTNSTIPQSLLRTYEFMVMFSFVSTFTNNNIITLQAEALVGAGVVAVHEFWAFKIS